MFLKVKGNDDVYVGRLAMLKVQMYKEKFEMLLFLFLFLNKEEQSNTLNLKDTQYIQESLLDLEVTSITEIRHLFFFNTLFTLLSYFFLNACACNLK